MKPEEFEMFMKEIGKELDLEVNCGKRGSDYTVGFSVTFAKGLAYDEVQYDSIEKVAQSYSEKGVAEVLRNIFELALIRWIDEHGTKKYDVISVATAKSILSK